MNILQNIFKENRKPKQIQPCVRLGILGNFIML